MTSSKEFYARNIFKMLVKRINHGIITYILILSMHTNHHSGRGFQVTVSTCMEFAIITKQLNKD